MANTGIKSLTYAITLLLWGGATAMADTRPPEGVHQDAPEQRLLQGISAITQLQHDNALASLEELLEDKPEFKLAQLVYADLLMARAGPIYDVGPGILDQAAKPLLDEAKARWKHRDQGHRGSKLPSYLLQIAQEQKHIIVVDLSESRLFLFENVDGTPQLRHDFYVSIGKNGAEKWKEGDKKTPVGVYFVTDYRSPETLPDFYGKGAFPINYPNHWDKRQGRTGHGIWLHGNPLSSFSRPPLDSDGCVTVTNQDLEFIKSFIDVDRTPFIIANGIEWVEKDAMSNAHHELKNTLLSWRDDWQSLENQRYLSHYSQVFEGPGVDYKAWKASKSATNNNKTFVQIGLNNVSIFSYPGRDDVAVITFEQSYRSDNYEDMGRKRQYWRKEEDGRWRIIYEGPV